VAETDPETISCQLTVIMLADIFELDASDVAIDVLKIREDENDIA
jgi:hypothetical protein